MRTSCPGSRRSRIVLVLALVAVSFGATARADLTLGFPDGLTGWNASDSTLVSAQNGLASILESSSALETDLYRDFTIPTGAVSLSFTLNAVNPDGDTFGPPDAFGASLLDPTTGNSLVPTVDANTDSFYIRDVVTGITQGQAASGVMTGPLADSLPLLVTVDLGGLSGADARIFFRLLAGGDLSDSSVVISNVVVTTSSVPEPASLLLGLIGLVSFLCMRVGSRSRPTGSSSSLPPA